MPKSLTKMVGRGLTLGRREARSRVQRSSAVAKRARADYQGHLILEGDSWFDLPFYDEITEALRESFNYKTVSAAHHGDTAQDMAYAPDQLRRTEDVFEDLADDKHVPRAILLSCGGNDVMDALTALMNAKASGLAVWSKAVVDVVVNQQVPLAIGTLIGRLVALSERFFRQRRPIILHGYGNPVPDGRGFSWVFTWKGPWMKPVFVRKGYVTADPQLPQELQLNANAMRELMFIFNEQTLPAIAAAANTKLGEQIAYVVDVRKALSSQIKNEVYKNSWRDELHGTGDAYQSVAALVDKAIRTAAPNIPDPLS